MAIGMRCLVAMMLAANVFNVSAHTWHCRNETLEIQCTGGKCERSTDFTPISVSIGDDRRMQICAYSGCWSGKGSLVRSGPYLSYTGRDLKWHSPSSGAAHFIVVIDTSDRIALIKGGGFAMPMTCLASSKP